MLIIILKLIFIKKEAIIAYYSQDFFFFLLLSSYFILRVSLWIVTLTRFLGTTQLVLFGAEIPLFYK